MEKFLIDFLEHPQNVRTGITGDEGPVVTISRDCGCSSNRIAIKLAKILSGYTYQSEKKKNSEWKWVNKEIIEQAAVALEITPDKIKDVFLKEAKVNLHEVTTAFSNEKIYDADDQEIIDTVRDVIFQLAAKGNCVIVGRAANVIAANIKNKLRVKLQAPFDWRVKRIKQTSSMSLDDAREYVKEIDRQRALFVEHAAGRKLGENDFDLVFNYATMDDDVIVDAVLHVMKTKRMI